MSSKNNAMCFLFLTPESYFYRYLTNLAIVILLFTVNILDKDTCYKPDAISCPEGTQETNRQKSNYFTFGLSPHSAQSSYFFPHDH